MDLHRIRVSARRARDDAARRLGEEGGAHAILMAVLDDLDLRYKVTPDGSVLGPTVAGRLYRRGRVIRVAERLSSADRTFTGAHELGHYLLHPGDHLELRAPEASLGMRASPHGTFDAIGYSERERIEREADAFASEFLVPSPWLRDQIVRLGRKPAAIADALGIDAAVVTAQAVYAVLLPEPMALRTGRARPTEPDPVQAAAARWPGRALLLEGRPGSGKTAALAWRVRHLAETAGPSQILVLSSTPANTDDLRSRLDGDEAVAAARPWIGTAAEIGFEIVAKNARALHRSERFRLLDETGAVALFEAGMPAGTGIPAIEAFRAVFGAKERLATPADWAMAAANEASRARGKPARDEAAVARAIGAAYAAYERALMRADAIDAADLAALPVRLLRDDARALAAVRHRFPHLVVDDLQDLGPAAIALVGLIASPAGTAWAAGGASQCVMGFRGATAASLDRFALRFGAQRMVLKGAYRPSSPTTAPPDTGKVSRIRDCIEDRRACGIAYGSQVILARSHAALRRAADGLEALGVPVAIVPDLIKEKAVGDLLAVAALVTEGSHDAFERLARLPEYGVPNCDVAKASTWAMARTGRLPRGLTRTGAESLRRLAADLEGLDAGTPAHSVMTTWLLERSSYLRRSLAAAPSPASRRSLAAMHHLIKVAEEHEAQRDRDHGRLVARAMRAGAINQDTAFKKSLAYTTIDAVQAITIHAARGLEFGAAHVIGSADRRPPIRRKTRNDPTPKTLRIAESESDRAAADDALRQVAETRSMDLQADNRMHDQAEEAGVSRAIRAAA